MGIKDFYCVFVRTEMNLIAFSRSRNCVNTQYAALSGAMIYGLKIETVFLYSRPAEKQHFIKFNALTYLS